MYTHSKHFFIILILLVLLCSCSAFQKDVKDTLNSYNNVSIKKNDIKILPQDQKTFTLATDITDKTTYKWFRCKEDKSNPTLIGMGKTLTVDWSESFNPIEYFYCEIDGKDTAVFTVAKTGLAAVEINTVDSEELVDKEQELVASFKLYKADNSLITDDFSDEEIEFSGHGNSTWNIAKHSFNVKLKKKNNLLNYKIEDKEKTKRNTKSKKWCLISNAYDRSLLRNYTSSKLATMLVTNSNGRIEGDWTAQMDFVDVTLNGKYQGTYLLTEKNRLEDESRVAALDIEKEWKSDEVKNFGFIVEVDARGDAVHKYTSPISGFLYTMCDPDLEDSENAEKIVEWIKAYMTDIEKDIYSQNWSNIQEKVDVTSLVNYFIVCELLKNKDSSTYSSLYMYRDTDDQKLHYGPIWDFDLSSGNESDAELASPEGYHYKNAGWFNELFKIPQFTALVKKAWNNNKEQIFDYIANGLTEDYKRISVSAKLNFDNWDTFGASEYPYAVGHMERDSFEKEFNYLQSWLKARYTWLDSQIAIW